MPTVVARAMVRGLVVALVVCGAPDLLAQEAPDSAGAHHDSHHEIASSAAAPRLGHVVFPTAAAPAAHREFILGILYLHNFHYPQAAAAFRRAQALDPGDVMSYWGEAVSYTHPVWNQQDTAAARTALRRLAPTPAARLAKARTRRERAWLATAEALYDDDASKARRDTLFSASLDHLRRAYPSDVDAELFYALSLLGLNQGDRDVPTYLRAYAIARRVFRTHPDHPGAAHYVIHAVDDPTHAAMGLDAARAYSRIAPDAGHAQHMTSHIFIALGMWDAVIAANLRAQSSGAPGTHHTFGHGVQWLIYALTQEGRYREAAVWLDSMRVQTERLAAASPGASDAEEESREYLVLDRAAYVAGTHEWRSPFAVMAIDTTGLDVEVAAANDLTLGLAALGRDERARADSILARMTSRNARTRAENGGREFSSLGYAQVMAALLRGASLRAAGDVSGAVVVLQTAAMYDDSLPFAFGPPVEIESPHERAGDYLLEVGRPADAVKEFRLALAHGPGRTASLVGLAKAERALGNRAEALKNYLSAERNWKRADPAWAPIDTTRSGVRDRD